jgi:hypothetical protein
MANFRWNLRGILYPSQKKCFHGSFAPEIEKGAKARKR